MINMVLYGDESAKRVVERTKRYFAGRSDMRAYGDCIWLNDMYIKFKNNMITVNPYNTSTDWKDKISEYMCDVLQGENVFVSGGNHFSRYYEIFTDLHNTSLCLWDKR